VLLRQNLTDTQLRQYTSFGYFDVRGGATGNRYRIHDIHSQNIDEADGNDVWVHTWCFSPSGDLERSNILLGQKMALELLRVGRATRWNEIRPASKTVRLTSVE
jgi:hypothetical protein